MDANSKPDLNLSGLLGSAKHKNFSGAARVVKTADALGAPEPVREAKSPAGASAQGVVTFDRMLGDLGPAKDRNRCVS